MIKITPRTDWLLINPEKVEDKVSEYGIVSPDTVEKERKAVGEVLDVGPDVVGIKKGDQVVFACFCGEEMEIKDEGKILEYKLVKSEDIIATITKTK